MSEPIDSSEVATFLKCGEDAVVRRFAKVRESSTSEALRHRNVGGIASCESRRSVVETILASKWRALHSNRRPCKSPSVDGSPRTSPGRIEPILNLAKAGLQSRTGRDRKADQRIATERVS